MASLALACAALWAPPLAPAASASDPFPEPAKLEPAIGFWMRVYLEATTDGGFLHDARRLGVVYELVRFEGETNSRRRERIVDERKRHWRGVLDRLALGGEPQNTQEREVVAALTRSIGGAPHPRDYLTAKNELRFQLGQRNKFRDGLIRSGAYEAEMRAIFRERGLPEDLAYLPHVESSFNVRAYSKYGAAGAWQFMRGTGRRFMKVDYVVDERLDPITSTHAAARLLSENYAMLGTWPLALTAYNHGAGGMQRAVKHTGTRDIAEIAERYESRSFGFASRNFYAQFAAARRILKSPESYFGPLEREAPRVVDVVTLPFYADVADLEKNLGVSAETIAALNPALRPPVFRSGKRIPRGYSLRLPAGTVVGDSATWLAAVPATQRHDSQHANRYYTVRRGDTLGRIAARNRTTVERLVAENDVGRGHRIYPGQVLQLPDRDGGAAPTGPAFALVREAQAAPAPAPASAPQPAAPPAPSSAPEPTPAPAVAVAVVAPEPAPAEPAPVVVATAEPQVAPPVEVEVASAVAGEPLPPLELALAPSEPVAPDEPVAPHEPSEPADESEGPEDADLASALEEAGESEDESESEEPSADDSEEVGPPEPEPVVLAALEPPTTEPATATTPIAPPGLSDDSPFRRVDRERVLVDAGETLGHFAEWLEVSPQRLRNLNQLKPRRAIRAGQTLRLDFSRVSPEVFQERRLEYHKGIEEDFFGSYRVTGTFQHTLRRGETLWLLSHKLYAVPSWLIHRYNPDVDLAKLVPGTVLVIPAVEKLS